MKDQSCFGTPTYPDFEVTLIHTRNGLEFIRATIEGRLCNVHYAAAAYMAGEREPHYLVPTLLGTTHIYPECVVTYTPDLVDGVPGITWWNESYGLPLPADHGQWNPN